MLHWYLKLRRANGTFWILLLTNWAPLTRQKKTIWMLAASFKMLSILKSTMQLSVIAPTFWNSLNLLSPILKMVSRILTAKMLPWASSLKLFPFTLNVRRMTKKSKLTKMMKIPPCNRLPLIILKKKMKALRVLLLVFSLETYPESLAIFKHKHIRPTASLKPHMIPRLFL